MPRDKRNQVNATLEDEVYARVLACVDRYGKKEKSKVAAEIIERYIGSYEALEEQLLRSLEDQRNGLGKALAPSRNIKQRARKTA